jgi:hypothetical protein
MEDECASIVVDYENIIDNLRSILSNLNYSTRQCERCKFVMYYEDITHECVDGHYLCDDCAADEHECCSQSDEDDQSEDFAEEVVSENRPLDENVGVLKFEPLDENVVVLEQD